MSIDKANAWADAAEYARAVASIGDNAARDRGVSKERIAEMQAALRILDQGDHDAFYVCMNDYAANGAHAVAQLVSARAESEAQMAMEEPTDPAIVNIPPEARGSDA